MFPQMTTRQIFLVEDKIENFLRNKQWKNGPDFLWQSESDWPPQPTLYSEGIPDPE